MIISTPFHFFAFGTYRTYALYMHMYIPVPATTGGTLDVAPASLRVLSMKLVRQVRPAPSSVLGRIRIRE